MLLPHLLVIFDKFILILQNKCGLQRWLQLPKETAAIDYL